MPWRSVGFQALARLGRLVRCHMSQIGAGEWVTGDVLSAATGDLNLGHVWCEEDFSAVETEGLRIGEYVEQVLSLLVIISGETASFQRAQVWLSLEAETHGQTPPFSYREVHARKALIPRFLVVSVLNHRYPWKTRIAT